MSPPLNQRHRILLQQRSVPTGMTAAAAAAASHSAKPLKFQTPRQPSTGSSGRTPLLQRTYVDHLTGETSVTSSFESETAFYTTPAPVQQNTSSTQTMVSMPASCDEIVGRASDMATDVRQLDASRPS